MSRRAILFGGTGYIGVKLAGFLREKGWDDVVLGDIKSPRGCVPPGVEYIQCDVRQPIADQLGLRQADWIFNLAAVHREPGHTFREYFDTNLPGARNVCAYAERIDCKNIFFTSSIAVYGEISQPTDESFAPYPDTGYGISKLCAELIHERWQSSAPGRRLIVVRPGVVYGPGDPGNILRMIHALQNGTFVMPGDGAVRKSYAYVYGLLESVEFMLSRPDACLCYNYVEKQTESLGELVAQAGDVLGRRRPVMRIPKQLLIAIAHVMQLATGGRSAIHPVRVRKAAQSTHIVPAELIRLGFEFRYDFVDSLRHWNSIAPEDFGSR